MNKILIGDREYKLVPVEEDAETFEPKEDADMTYEDVKYHAENEGVGYLLLDYCSYSDIKDSETRLLFGKAYKAVKELTEHLEIE